MQTKIIEGTSGPLGNWGKFLVGRYDEEWYRFSAIPQETDPEAAPEDDPELVALRKSARRERPILHEMGWTDEHLWVMDMQTGEGAFFRIGGYAAVDLNKHAIWVCPLFEHFLAWLYTQDLTDISTLPDYVEFPDAEFNFRGHRRPGGSQANVDVQAIYALNDLAAREALSFLLAGFGLAIIAAGGLHSRIREVERLYSLQIADLLKLFTPEPAEQ